MSQPINSSEIPLPDRNAIAEGNSSLSEHSVPTGSEVEHRYSPFSFANRRLVGESTGH